MSRAPRPRDWSWAAWAHGLRARWAWMDLIAAERARDAARTLATRARWIEAHAALVGCASRAAETHERGTP